MGQGNTRGEDKSLHTTIIAVPKGGEGPIVNVKPELDLVSSGSNGSSYFTQVNQAEGKLRGFRLNTNMMKAENTWRVNYDPAKQVIREVSTQFQSPSQATKGIGYLPTVFGQEGDLFYKFIDHSMFSVVTESAEDPSTLTIYIINGVTGRIVHQFKETNVSTHSQHKVCSFFSEQFFILSFMRSNPTTGIS